MTQLTPETSKERYQTGADMLAALGPLDEDSLAKLRSDMCVKLGIRDTTKAETRIETATDVSQLLGWGGEKEELKDDPEKLKIISKVIKTLREISTAKISDAISNHWQSGDYHIARLQGLVTSLHYLNLHLTDIFPSADPELESIIERRYYEGIANAWNKKLTNPYAVGVYSPAEKDTTSAIIPNNNPPVGVDFAEHEILENLRARPEYKELYETVAKNLLLLLLKLNMVRHPVRNEDMRNGYKEQFQMQVGPHFGNENIYWWLKECFELGITLKQILGTDNLSDIFMLTEGHNATPVSAEASDEYLKVLQEETKSGTFYQEISWKLAETLKKHKIENRVVYLSSKKPVKWEKILPVATREEARSGGFFSSKMKE